MKHDIPPPLSVFFDLAEVKGYIVRENVTEQLLKVISIDRDRPLIRYFAPELLLRPWGPEIGGTVGMALANQDGIYSCSVFHHLANYHELRKLDRRLDRPEEIDTLLDSLRALLSGLPADACEAFRWSEQPGTWLAKNVEWQLPPSLEFVSRARDLCASTTH